MPELTSLQYDLLRVLEQNSKRDLLRKVCKLTGAEIIAKMEKKPSSENYLTTALKILEQKGKIRVSTSYEVGYQGMRRIITIL